MNRKQFGQVSLANTKTVDKSHSSIEMTTRQVFLSCFFLHRTTALGLKSRFCDFFCNFNF